MLQGYNLYVNFPILPIKLCCVRIKIMNPNTNIEKNPERVAIVKKIEEFEREGKWSIDVENDPPTIPLEPDQVDYLNKKLINKFLSYVITKKAWKFIKNLVETKKMIIKDIVGMENYEKIKDTGCMITCNHFNAFDNFCIHYAIMPDLFKSHKNLWIVIREGNYTNFPGFYGYLFRGCNTLPFSSNYSVTKEFFEGIKTLLKKKQKILVYAEQGMWWNYRKPRPLTAGAFKFAAESKVPVLPIFITMNDSDKIGADGFPIQEYTLHFLPAIYPDETKSIKENMEIMKDKNYAAWKEVYEKTYGIPLTYSCDTAE